MKILVTGGAGFIGSNLVDKLLLGGHQVLVVDNFSSGKMTNLAVAESMAGNGRAAIKIVEADIVEVDLRLIFAEFEPDVVVHLAAQIDVRKSVADPVFDAEVNVLGTIKILEACVEAKVNKFVFVSSGGCIYGEPDYLPVDESHQRRPETPYGLNKDIISGYLEYYRKNYDLEFATLALGNVYGPRQDPLGEAGVVAIFANKMLAGEQTIIYGDGDQVRDYIYVDDVCNAFSLAIGKPVNKTINIGSGIGTSVNELHASLAGIIGYGQAPRYYPPRPGELYKIFLESKKARELLGWQPCTPLLKGLESTVESLSKISEPNAFSV